jgi:hypothetical protein
MNGFSFKISSVHGYLVKKLNPQKITRYGTFVGGNFVSKCGGPTFIYYIILNEIQKGREAYTVAEFIDAKV